MDDMDLCHGHNIYVACSRVSEVSYYSMWDILLVYILIGDRLMGYKCFAKVKALISKMTEPYDEEKKPIDDNIMRPTEHLVINTEELIQWYFPVPGIDIEYCKHNIDLYGLLTIKAKNAEECYQYAVQLLWDDADFDRAIVTKRIVKGYLVVDGPGASKFHLIPYYDMKAPVGGLLQRFINGDDEFRTSSLYFCSHVHAGNVFFAKWTPDVGPIRVSEKLRISYVRGKNYLEIGIDVSSYTPAASLASNVITRSTIWSLMPLLS